MCASRGRVRAGGRLMIRVAVCFSLIAFVAACDTSSPPKTSSASPPLASPLSPDSPQPHGLPLIFGWDGVDSRMLMASVVANFNGSPPDPTTWTLSGTRWVKVSTAMTVPLARGVLAYDSGRNREILVGQSAEQLSAGAATSTWEWDGQSWRQVKTAHAPDTLYGYLTGAYSPELRATVVVDSRSLGPTWLFDGTDWRSVGASHEQQQYSHVMYDVTRHSIVAITLAFSNYQNSYHTWQFDGRDWSPIATIGGATPGGWQSPVVGLDQERDLWVVFGGNNVAFDLADTWTSEGTSWTGQAPTTSPPARSMSPIEWDPSHHRLVMFGGVSRTGRGGEDFDGDTWTWDGSIWAHVAGPLPAPVAIPPQPDVIAYPSPLYAGMAAIEAKTGLVYSPEGCTPTATCLGAPHVFGNPDVFTAAYVQMAYSGSGGTDCFAYSFPDGGGWHYTLPVVCPKQTGFNPVLGGQDRVTVTETCANVRESPSLGSRVVICVKDGTVVSIDSDFPRYVDGHIWWSINGHQGWMAHDFLISPSS
jgi:hypothetical protein